MIHTPYRKLRAGGAFALVLAAGCRHFQESPWLHRDKGDSSAIVDGDDGQNSLAAKASSIADPAADKPGVSKKPSRDAIAEASPQSGDGAKAKQAPKSGADDALPTSSKPEAATVALAEAASKRPAIDDTVRAALSKDAWSVKNTLPGIRPDKSGWRYRNPALDELLHLPPDEQPQLDELVGSRNPLQAANAAIVQVRWRQAEPIARLSATIRNGELRIVVRFAAIEALTGVAPVRGRPAIEALLEVFGDPAGASADRYVARLHGELLMALARNDASAALPYWAAALKSPDPKVQVLALEALADGDAPLPAALAAMRDETDPTIRAAALRALAKHRDPKALEYLKHALDDYDLPVRLAAIAGLGEIRSPKSRVALEKMMHASGEVVRAAAVESLAALDADDAVAAAAGDKASRVRQSVANALSRSDGMISRRPREAAQIIATLIGDRAPDVQRAAVVAVAGWPLEQAGPMLLAGMRENGYLVRKTAAAQLAQRWAPAADFPIESSSVDVRIVAIDSLRAAWTAQFGQLSTAPERYAPIEPPGVTLRRFESQWRDAARRAKFEDGANPLAWVREALGQEASAEAARLAAPPGGVEQARALVATLASPSLAKRDRDAAIEGLKNLGAAILPVLDEIAAVDSQPLPEAIYTEVLPAIQPVFATLLEIRSAKPTERWSVAERLAAYVAQRPLPALALARLADIMPRENDSLVWQSVLASLVHDPREPANRMAAMAVGHDSPEVRRRAAEYFAQHGSPKHAALLLPLLEDSQLTVVLAAVNALAVSGPLENPAPLVAMLTHDEAPLRLATALALARLGVPQGRPALERLADDVDADVRRGAAVAMGTLEDESYAPFLIKLLDDRQDVALAAMTALVKIVGRDMAANPADDAPVSSAERIQRWQRWQRERSVRSPSAAPSS